MKKLRLPPWLKTGMLDRYQSGASHLFLLHGNVRDLHPFGDDYLPLAEGLRRLLARRSVVVSYDVSQGLSFPDAARQKAFRQVLGLEVRAPARSRARAHRSWTPSSPATELLLPSVGIVIEYAHTLVPSGPGSAAERQSITTLARWASDPRVAARRPLVILIAPSVGRGLGRGLRGRVGGRGRGRPPAGPRGPHGVRGPPARDASRTCAGR